MPSKKQQSIVCGFVLGLLLMGCSAKGGSHAAEKPAKLDPIGETGLKKITLTQKASDRLGIQVGTVREETVAQKRSIGAEVVGAPNSDKLWVRARLNEAELAANTFDQAVQVAAPGSTVAISATPDPGPGPGNAADEGTRYFVLSGTQHGLQVGQMVFVALPMREQASKHKIIPHAAVLYDAKGETWTYVHPEPLVFVRQKIRVESFDGDQAILADGPAPGTEIVTFGAAELYGAETGVGK